MRSMIQQSFPGENKTNFVIHEGRAVIASFIWFPAYRGEREKIYINIDIDRHAARHNDIPILD